jgi:uncharacterized NAD(P)/FAD-binding protein YdhS
MSTSRFDVAVIGAGFTGADLAIQLINRLPAGASVLLVGSPGEVGRGLAYGVEDPQLLLNVRAGRLSLHTDDEAHFVRWLARGCGGGTPLTQAMLSQAYVTRAAYGRYVRDGLRRAIDRASGRVAVRVAEGTAVRLQPFGDELRIRLASGERFAAAAAALCLGNPAARLPLASDAIDAAARARVIADPWRDERMRRIAPDADVLFVGSGLTMVDQVLLLDRRGHGGRLAAISRHGLVPAAQPAAAPVPLPVELPPAADGLTALFRTLVAAARQAQATGRDWRGIFEALRPHHQAIWQELGDRDRRRFMRHLEAFWSVHRHRMAPAVAARIATLRADGRLDVAARRLLAVGSEPGGGLRVTLRPRGSASSVTRRFDWVVNCTGSGRYAALMRQPLVAGLVERGLVRPDPLRLGLDVDDASRLVGRGGRAIHNLFALGPLTAGRFFEITAVAEIRSQVSEVADRLAALHRAQRFRRGQAGALQEVAEERALV